MATLLGGRSTSIFYSFKCSKMAGGFRYMRPCVVNLVVNLSSRNATTTHVAAAAFKLNTS